MIDKVNTSKESLINEINRLVDASKNGNFNIALNDKSLSGEDASLDAEIIRKLNEVIRNYNAAVEYELIKYKLTRDALDIGLWDMVVIKGDPVNPSNEFIWSDELRKMLGFSDEHDLPNVLSYWIDRIHPDDRERVVGLFYDHLNDRTGKIKLDGEYRLMLKNGQYRHFHAFGTTLRDKDGAPLRVAGAIEDIEEKKQMQQAILQRERMLNDANALNQAILASAPMGMILYDENLKIIDCNEAICKMFGMDKEQCIESFFKLMPEFQPNGEKSLVMAEKIMRQALEGRKVIVEWTHVMKSGKTIPCEVTLTRILAGGKYIGLAHTYDISHIKKLTSDLEKALKQATAASRAKGDFLSNMSHEMRTPLNAIIGMTAIGRKADSIEKKNYALGQIGDASSHLLGVINDVLDMAKIEANKLELSEIEFDFDKLLQTIISVINFRMEERRQKFTVNIDKDIPRFIIGDDQRLSQVITNLLSNANKFTHECGSIRLEAVLLDEKDGWCTIRIEVEDDGIGISDEQQRRLFHAFEQADSGTSREYGGTGLGLVISQNIVELMGGRIWVESELGKGAKFVFVIKVKRGQQKDDDIAIDSASSMEETIGAFKGKKMLLAEDIEINREILIALLEETQIEIDCAENGKQALEKIEENPGKYDIIFMDVQMPQMDGLEATRRIRALEAQHLSSAPSLEFAQQTPRLSRCSKSIPIIAMTANVFKSDIEECIKAGMNEHLGKPIEIDKLLAVLEKYLEG